MRMAHRLDAPDTPWDEKRSRQVNIDWLQDRADSLLKAFSGIDGLTRLEGLDGDQLQRLFDCLASSPFNLERQNNNGYRDGVDECLKQISEAFISRHSSMLDWHLTPTEPFPQKEFARIVEATNRLLGMLRKLNVQPGNQRQLRNLVENTEESFYRTRKKLGEELRSLVPSE
jgi:hypothetical protein